MTFSPPERPPDRDERFDRDEFVPRDEAVFDEAPRPGRWLARVLEVRLRAVVLDDVAREVFALVVFARVLVPAALAPVVDVVVALDVALGLALVPERERVDEPPLERRREWGTVEVIG